MVVVEKAVEAARVAVRDPVVVGVAALFALVKVPVFLMQVHGLLYAGAALLTFVVTPFLLSGLFGVSAGALGDGAAVEQFTGGGTAGYANLLVANVVYSVVRIAVILLVSLGLSLAALVVLGVGVAAGSGDRLFGDPGLVPLAGLGAAGLLGLLAVLGVDFLLQFYDVSAVVGGNDVGDAFAESYRLVVANRLTTLGFMALRLTVLGLLASPLVVLLYALGSTEPGTTAALGTPALAGVVALAYAVGVATFAFFVPYKTAVYRALDA